MPFAIHVLLVEDLRSIGIYQNSGPPGDYHEDENSGEGNLPQLRWAYLPSKQKGGEGKMKGLSA
jgi:hypothetical protein